MVELQNGLKKYDPQKDKHFSGSVKLPHIPRLKMKFSRLADAQQVEEDQKIGVVYMDVEGLKKPNKNKFFVKKLAKKFHLFYPQRLLSSRFLVFLDLVLTTQVYMHVPSDLHFLSFMVETTEELGRKKKKEKKAKEKELKRLKASEKAVVAKNQKKNVKKDVVEENLASDFFN